MPALYPLLVSFGNWLIMNVLRVAVVKFAVFTAVALLISALAVLVFNSLIDIDLFAFGQMIQSLPDGLLYFLTVFQFHVGIPLVLGAYVSRFAIRRLPVIG